MRFQPRQTTRDERIFGIGAYITAILVLVAVVGYPIDRTALMMGIMFSIMWFGLAMTIFFEAKSDPNAAAG